MIINLYHKQDDRAGVNNTYDSWQDAKASYASYTETNTDEDVYNHITQYLSNFGTGQDYAVVETLLEIDGRVAFHAGRTNRSNPPDIWVNQFKQQKLIIQKTPLEI